MKQNKANSYLALKISELILLDSQSKNAGKLMDEMDVCFQVSSNQSDNIKEKIVYGAIYELVDLYYDSYFEGFPNVVAGYSFEEAKRELTVIAKILMDGNIEQLINSDFVEKINKLLD